MFTGIIQALGRIARIEPNAFGQRLIVDPGGWDYRPDDGDSIAVNGVCLTCTAEGAGDQFAFDVIRETLDRSTLGKLRVGDPVNLESSLTPDTPMGGHFVQGHVDGLGAITHIESTAEQWRGTIQCDVAVMPCVIPKGSVAIDGVSLTIASVDVAARTFDVALIPSTLRMTNLGAAKVGDRVNLETDLIARTIVHWLSHFAGQGGAAGLTLDKLRDAGFAG